MEEKLDFFERWVRNFEKYLKIVLNKENFILEFFNLEEIQRINNLHKEKYGVICLNIKKGETIRLDNPLVLSMVSNYCFKIHALCDLLIGAKLKEAEILFLIPKMEASLNEILSADSPIINLEFLSEKINEFLVDLKNR